MILNRTPILHKLCMLVFMVKLNNKDVIKVHPILVYKRFNVNFNDDLMVTTHVSLTNEVNKIMK
ncbi:hypothetical protein [Candidatus Hodgkinia cicadicola]|uniref:hypothetical protein n=1 Tax=Candidatus Hodgkinia cicadicola TaxID=573658 RepID=UPI0039BFB99E